MQVGLLDLGLLEIKSVKTSVGSQILYLHRLRVSFKLPALHGPSTAAGYFAEHSLTHLEYHDHRKLILQI